MINVINMSRIIILKQKTHTTRLSGAVAVEMASKLSLPTYQLYYVLTYLFHSFQRTNSISPRSESRPKSEVNNAIASVVGTAGLEAVGSAAANGRRPSSPMGNGESATKKLKKDEVRI